MILSNAAICDISLWISTQCSGFYVSSNTPHTNNSLYAAQQNSLLQKLTKLVTFPFSRAALERIFLHIKKLHVSPRAVFFTESNHGIKKSEIQPTLRSIIRWLTQWNQLLIKPTLTLTHRVSFLSTKTVDAHHLTFPAGSHSWYPTDRRHVRMMQFIGTLNRAYARILFSFKTQTCLNTSHSFTTLNTKLTVTT
jgi:hypothetical protein